VLKEVEVPQPLDLGIVDLVLSGGPRMTEAGAAHEIDANGHLLFASVEVHLLDEPRLGDTKSFRKQVVDLVRHTLSTEFPIRPRRQDPSNSCPTPSTREPSH
jgi:hypothetical protein